MENTQLLNWFQARGISRGVLEESGVSWTGDAIKIPIRDVNGQVVSYKYRRSPWSDEGPKYWYGTGGKAALFNIELIQSHSTIFLTEGEFDALCLHSMGFFAAVSSTGGSGTFNEEWRDLFLDKEVYIIYDIDDAGYKGALHVQSIIPWAKIIWLPKMKEGKDVTDFFMEYTKENFRELMQTAMSWRVPSPLTELPKTKKAMEDIIREDNAYADELLAEEKNLGKPRYLEILKDHVLNRVEKHRRMLRFWNQTKSQATSDRLQLAKDVPIDKYLEFNSSNTALCIWHNEKSPSLHYYIDKNRVFCFGCRRGGDTVDVVQQLNKCNVIEAIDMILNQ